MAEQKKSFPQPLKKVLIVKINAIGDVVMALPMATYLRTSDPHVHITWMCGTIPTPLLEASQIIDEIIQVDEKQLLTGNLFQKCFALIKIWKKLLFRRFDHIYMAHLDPRYKLLTLFTRAKERKNLSLIPGRYHSDEYVRLVSGIDQCKAVLPKWKLTPTKKSIIALAPGGAKNALADNALRRWPIENYVTIAKELTSRGYQVAITGSESDQWILPYFSDLSIVDFVGKLSLVELVDFYNKCALLITHDSGPLHLGKLADVPTIALFGPTLPLHFVEKNPANIKVLWGGEGLSCSPCHSGKTFAACTNNLCMKNISTTQVLSAISEILILP